MDLTVTLPNLTNRFPFKWERKKLFYRSNIQNWSDLFALAVPDIYFWTKLIVRKRQVFSRYSCYLKAKTTGTTRSRRRNFHPWLISLGRKRGTTRLCQGHLRVVFASVVSVSKRGIHQTLFRKKGKRVAFTGRGVTKSSLTDFVSLTCHWLNQSLTHSNLIKVDEKYPFPIFLLCGFLALA